MGVTNYGYREAAKKWAQAQTTFQAFASYYTAQAASEFKKVAAKNSPVETGHLRRSWEVGPVERDAKTMRASVYNTTNYAIHVEYGHRIIRNGKYVGYVPAQYFFARSLSQFRPMFRQIAKDCQRDINKALGGGG